MFKGKKTETLFRTVFSLSFWLLNASIKITFNHCGSCLSLAKYSRAVVFLLKQFVAKRMQFVVLMLPIKYVVVSYVAQWNFKTFYLLMELSPEN